MTTEVYFEGCGRRDSNSHGRRGAGGLATGKCPTDPKSVVYTDSTTPAQIVIDERKHIGENFVTYGLPVGRDPEGNPPRKRTPLGGLGLGGLPRRAYLIAHSPLVIHCSLECGIGQGLLGFSLGPRKGME